MLNEAYAGGQSRFNEARSPTPPSDSRTKCLISSENTRVKQLDNRTEVLLLLCSQGGERLLSGLRNRTYRTLRRNYLVQPAAAAKANIPCLVGVVCHPVPCAGFTRLWPPLVTLALPHPSLLINSSFTDEVLHWVFHSPNVLLEQLLAYRLRFSQASPQEVIMCLHLLLGGILLQIGCMATET